MSDKLDRITEYYRRPINDRRQRDAIMMSLVELRRRLANVEAWLKECEEKRSSKRPENHAGAKPSD